MSYLQPFHQVVGELLSHLGFDIGAIHPEQEVISLTVEQQFTVHLAWVDQASWCLLAELGSSHPERDGLLYAQALRYNQMAAQRWQPVWALDPEDHLSCWLRLPLEGNELPTLIEAFDVLIQHAEQWLAVADVAPGHFSKPI
ncbi:CesT family type III secretion system chaperone [Iodobacter fluviatilis]|uniref:Tir chaperone family protein CesT n=1 Tax=Iodobacter fluviatilis TaxID=537 RepID=A0A377Q4J6_9NEIS|nr:CesT family type III secretion system chaperone [Iodobacter fluviatilis]TCU80265.1 Tir chaperone family protein CesT [Iodobacter fluviatilis]STQ90196.1 Tir chaperone protein (CesT) [Iodobacter fluviatilis]